MILLQALPPVQFVSLQFFYQVLVIYSYRLKRFCALLTNHHLGVLMLKPKFLFFFRFS